MKVPECSPRGRSDRGKQAKIGKAVAVEQNGEFGDGGVAGRVNLVATEA